MRHSQVRPHKITYYLERRDPDFEAKMAQVLYIYREVQILREAGKEVSSQMAVLSYDEKPGIQVLENTAPDLPPVPGHHSSVGRDHEYIRHGTLSLLAGIDLLTGHVHGVSGQAARGRRRAWREHFGQRAVKERGPPERIATAMLAWPNEFATWKDVAAQGQEVERLFWSRKQARPLIDAVDEAIVAAAGHYADAGRHVDALEACAPRVAALPSELLLRLLDGALVEIAQAGGKGGVDSGTLSGIFDELASRSDISPIEVARREFAWLPRLEWSTHKLTLHRLLAANTQFFVEVLCEIYQPRPRERDEEISEARRARAAQGYRLLRSWKTLPGMRPGQPPDYRGLRAWIDAARNGAREAGRSEVADIHIGQLLAHAPSDADDLAWPSRPVRGLIEDLASSEIEKGIATERFNMRGVTQKAAFEGGGQERELAEQVKGWARAAAEWPRVARLLTSLAETWENYGQREDERAELDKLQSF